MTEALTLRDPQTAPERIVVFLPNWVGDAVMATPALRALRRHFDCARIVHVGRPAAIETLGGTKWADEVLVDRSAQPPRVRNAVGIMHEIRARRFELAVLLPNSFRVALLARLGGVGRIAGYDRDARGWLLKDKLRPLRDQQGDFEPISAIDYYLDLVGMLGASCDSRRMVLAVTEADEAAAEAMLAEAGADGHRPIVMLNPGASFGVSKMWDPERFAAVADALVERRRARIIINAAPAERAVAAGVARAMRHRPAINFAERDNTLGLLKGLIRRCALLITNDTGARHFAAAFGVGVVTVFGSTDPRWAQIDYENERIVRMEVDCSPCQKKMCLQSPGPMYHQCMAAITPDMVLALAEELLDSPGRAVGGRQ